MSRAARKLNCVCGHMRVWHTGYVHACQFNGPQPQDGCSCKKFQTSAPAEGGVQPRPRGEAPLEAPSASGGDMSDVVADVSPPTTKDAQ